jgi:hypothetical protein
VTFRAKCSVFAIAVLVPKATLDASPISSVAASVQGDTCNKIQNYTRCILSGDNLSYLMESKIFVMFIIRLAQLRKERITA